MELTKAEARALYFACVVFLKGHSSDLIEHLMWRLEQRVSGGSQ